MKDYKLVKADGVAAVIIWKNKVLLLKRRRIPFIYNPGTWGFLTGSRKPGERYLETAYREIKEETGIGRKQLTRVLKPAKVSMFDGKKGKRWLNYLFIFRSETGNVRINIENAGWRWAKASEIRDGNDYTNIFLNKDKIYKTITRCLKNGKRPEKV